MALPLDVLIQPLTKEQVQASILSLASAAGLRVTAWQTGGVALSLIGVMSQVFAGFTTGAAAFVRGGFLDLATGDYLTLTAKFVYNVDRIRATFAGGNQTVTNTGGAMYAFDPGEFIVANLVTGVTFTNTNAFTLQPVGQAGATVTISIQAQEAGSAGTSAAGAVSRVVTTLPGVTTTNAGAYIGVDGESDPALRQRCRDKLGSLSPNGPRSAYEYIAKSAVDNLGVSLGVTRVQVQAADGSGTVVVWPATASGPLTTAALAIVDNDIRRKAVPDSVRADVQNSVSQAVNVNVTMYVDHAANLSTADVQALVQSALLAAFPTIPIGGFRIYGPFSPTGALPVRWIEHQCDSVHPAVIEAVVSGGDIALLAGKVAQLGTLTVSVVFVGGGA